MKHHSIVCAGIDTGKHKLDAAIDGSGEQLAVDNSPAGHVSLAAWLRRRQVERVGIEASGGYEQAVVASLRASGFVVVVLQPAQVRAYARFVLQHAKNDALDAALIARCAAARTTIHEPPDARLAPLAEHLTLIEQLTDDIAQIKTRREGCRDQRVQAFWRDEIKRRNGLVRDEVKRLVAAIRVHADLGRRLDLIASVDGVGLRTAVAVLVRMPEIGRVSREQAAALAGLAPFDDDSGQRRGARHIKAGRTRLRGALYAATLPAVFHWNRQLNALYKRLMAAGKAHRLAMVACARKLLIYINTVVERDTPWTIMAPAASL